jgi:hypothetical protein
LAHPISTKQKIFAEQVHPMKMERRVTPRQETIMNSTEAFSENFKVRIETVANLIYLARHVEGRSKRNDYLDQAGKVIEELARHPMLCE